MVVGRGDGGEGDKLAVTWPRWPGGDPCLFCPSPAFRQGCDGQPGSPEKEHSEVLLPHLLFPGCECGPQGVCPGRKSMDTLTVTSLQRRGITKLNGLPKTPWKKASIILMVPCRCLADPRPRSHEPPPERTPCELFLACPVVQKRGSSFQGDVGRLKVKAIGTILGSGDESSACYASPRSP